MNYINPQSTVRADLAADALRPAPLILPTIATIEGQHFRMEPWRLADGQTVVIMRTLVDGPTLMNWSNEIAADMRARWGDDVVIVEDWGRAGPGGDRYHVSDGKGGCLDFAVDAFAARGLMLTDDLVQEPYPDDAHVRAGR